MQIAIIEHTKALFHENLGKNIMKDLVKHLKGKATFWSTITFTVLMCMMPKTKYLKMKVNSSTAHTGKKSSNY